MGLIPGSGVGGGDPLEEGMATHPSILAWRIPWTEEPGRLQSIGLQRVWSDLASMHILIIVWHLKIVLFLECFKICPAPLTHWQVKDLLPNFIPQLCIFRAVLIHLLNRLPSALPVQTYQSKYTYQKSKSLEILATEVIIFIWFKNWGFFFYQLVILGCTSSQRRVNVYVIELSNGKKNETLYLNHSPWDLQAGKKYCGAL